MTEHSRVLKTLAISDSLCTVPKVRTSLQIKVIHSEGLASGDYKRGLYLCAEYIELVDDCKGTAFSRRLPHPQTVLVRPMGHFSEKALSAYSPAMHEVQDLLRVLPTRKGVKAFQASDILF